MTNTAGHNLLTASHMAFFVTHGYLQLDELVPHAHNEAVLKDEKRLADTGGHFWYRSEAVQAVFSLPQVKSAVPRFVGVNPIYHHSHLHIVWPYQTKAP